MKNANHSEPADQLVQARADLKASAAEVGDFLHNLHGQSPQEMLGTIAQSHLARAVLQASVGCVVLLAVLTVGPYLYDKQFPAAAPVARAAEKAVVPEAPAAEPLAPAVAAATADTGKKPPVSKDALDKMGLSETKTTSPKANPLDKSADDLFKDLDK